MKSIQSHDDPKKPFQDFQFQCQAVLTFAIQLHVVFCVVAFSQHSVSNQAAEHPLTNADSIWLHLLQAIFMLFISTARYKISDYCNILPESPYGKKYKQSEGHEKRREKKTGRAALLWLLFSVRVWEEGMEGSITFNYGTPTNSIY